MRPSREGDDELKGIYPRRSISLPFVKCHHDIRSLCNLPEVSVGGDDAAGPVDNSGPGDEDVESVHLDAKTGELRRDAAWLWIFIVIFFYGRVAEPIPPSGRAPVRRWEGLRRQGQKDAQMFGCVTRSAKISPAANFLSFCC